MPCIAHEPGKQLHSSCCPTLLCYLFSWMRNQDCRPLGLLPAFEREVSVETRSASSQAQMTSELHYQSFLMQDADVDGA